MTPGSLSFLTCKVGVIKNKTSVTRGTVMSIPWTPWKCCLPQADFLGSV